MTREEAKRILRELRGREHTITNDSEGVTVPLSRGGHDKMVSSAAVGKSVANGFTKEQHYAVVSDIANLFRDALKIHEHPDKNDDHNIRTIHRFATPLHFGDAVAYITVKESKEHGNRLYSVECIKIEKLVGITGKLYDESPRLTPSTRASHKLYDDNIRKLQNQVKL